jgi:hypothetical protein
VHHLTAVHDLALEQILATGRTLLELHRGGLGIRYLRHVRYSRVKPYLIELKCASCDSILNVYLARGMVYAQLADPAATRRRRASDGGCATVPAVLFPIMSSAEAFYGAGSDTEDEEQPLPDDTLEDDAEESDYELMFSNTKEIFIGSVESNAIHVNLA